MLWLLQKLFGIVPKSAEDPTESADGHESHASTEPIAINDQESFVEYLNQRCLEWEGHLMDSLRTPANADEATAAARHARWFQSLSLQDQEAVRDIIRDAILSSMFHLLVQFDGCGALAGTRDDGMLHMTYVDGAREVLLAGPGPGGLHEIFWQFLEPGFRR